MFCPECGTINDDNAAFCCNCGTKLQNPGPAPIATPSPLIKKEKKEREPLEPIMRFALIEAAVAVCCIALFVIFYNIWFSPKHAVEKYTEAVQEQDWNQVYNLLLIDQEDTFLTKEAFLTYCSIYEDSMELDRDVDSITKKSGGFSKQTFRVRYDYGEYTDKVNLTVKRSGLSWKIEDDSYIVKDYQIAVPAGTEVSLDKIPVAGIVEPKQEEDGRDVYKFTRVFGYTHYIEVSGEDIETTQQLVDNYGETPTYIDTQISQKKLEEISKQSVQDLKEILEGAALGKSFTDVPVLKEMSEIQKEDAIDSYESLRDYSFAHDDEDDTITSFEFTDIEVSSRAGIYDYDDQTIAIYPEISGTLTYKGTSKSWWGNHEYEIGADKVKKTFDMYYIKEDGEWKLYNFSIYFR
ncbi:MAG: hypothetical protein HFG41_10555 [Coprococcus sp.]|nr:hypothetical protein [Coprococcus sp.]